MNENEKLKYHLQKIEEQFPHKRKLNLGQMLMVIGKSRSTFTRIVEANNLHLMPKFKTIVHNRQCSTYKCYEIDIHDLAEFLTNN